MKNIRSQNTKIERIISSALKKEKIYFASNVKNIMGKPDIVFRRKRIVIFLDSDFWHGHIERCKIPKSNVQYWNSKIERNRIRDKIVNKTLSAKGWIVLRFWEKDILKDTDEVVKKILNVYNNV